MISLSDLLGASAEIREDLDWPFDFSFGRLEPDDIAWIRWSTERPFAGLAADGCGGCFLTVGSEPPEQAPIWYLSHGQAGRVASNLTEWLALLMAAPYWRDLLKFSGNGELAEMRATAAFVASDYAVDFEDLPVARERIMSALPIPVLEDPVRILHDNVHATIGAILGEDDLPLESLFGSKTSSDNPSWK